VLGSRELDHLDDLSLLRGTAEGDRRAFQALVGRHEAALRRFLGSIVRDDAGAAEDALQETLLAVFRQAKRFEGRSAVRSWLFGIAFRQASKVRRRRVGEPAGHEPLDALGVAAGWGAADADGVDPEAVLARGEALSCLAQAFERLGEEDQTVVLLRDVEQLTGPETARVLGLPLPAMKSRLHRARLRLLAALRETPCADELRRPDADPHPRDPTGGPNQEKLDGPG
jgi:RNA polymerase sigma-70 factor (ECF subfamily)